MRKVHFSKIKNIVSELCVMSNIQMRPDIKKAIQKAILKENSKKAKGLLEILLKNAYIAKKERRALCQDTGFVTVFVRIGRDVKITGGSLKEAINDGIREAYRKFYFRKSVVKSPVIRENTMTNTPAAIYVDIVSGSNIKLNIVPKGFGCENKSKIAMLNPQSGEKELVDFAKDTVKKAGPDACPPFVLGIGIGGTFEKAAILAKEALTLPINRKNPKSYLRRLETKILEAVNKLNIGPMGLGGRTTCLGVNIIEYPTHIAGFPVAINIGCHATRSANKII